MTPDKPPSGVAGWIEVGTPEWRKLLRRPRRWRHIGYVALLVLFGVNYVLAEQRATRQRAALMVKLAELTALAELAAGRSGSGSE